MPADNTAWANANGGNAIDAATAVCSKYFNQINQRLIIKCRELKYCSRYYNYFTSKDEQKIIIVASVAPFEVTVNFDDNEAWTAVDNADTNEWAISPGGIIGMCLLCFYGILLLAPKKNILEIKKLDIIFFVSYS